MTNLYFDESIRDDGRFIVGALVISEVDLTELVRNLWLDMGLEPDLAEFKSSSLKQCDLQGQDQRAAIRKVLPDLRLALTVCPREDRANVGTHAVQLVIQLLDVGGLDAGSHDLYVDQGISVSLAQTAGLAERGVRVHANQDSRAAAGIQVADYTAHALGGMLLEEMGIVRKTVSMGEEDGYEPAVEVALGFELWASVRCALVGNNENVPGRSTPGDPANPYFRVDGYGLYVTPSCSPELASHARSRFGTNYLGCIH